MIVTITFKLSPTPGHLYNFPAEYREFRDVMEQTVQRGGFGDPQTIRTRFLIDTGKGEVVAEETPVVTG